MITSMRMAAVSCLVFALAMPAVAQSLRVDIPFDFQMAGSSLSAGHYVVSVDLPSHRIVLSDYSGNFINTVFLASTLVPLGKDRTSVVFHKYGEQYFLRQVLTPGTSVSMPVSREEKYVKRASTENRGPKMALVRVTLQ